MGVVAHLIHEVDTGQLPARDGPTRCQIRLTQLVNIACHPDNPVRLSPSDASALRLLHAILDHELSMYTNPPHQT